MKFLEVTPYFPELVTVRVWKTYMNRTLSLTCIPADNVSAVWNLSNSSGKVDKYT